MCTPAQCAGVLRTTAHILCLFSCVTLSVCEKADLRISARRNRIKNRISAARKIRKMIQIKHMFGYHSTTAQEAFPVEAQCDASRALIENVIDNGSELVTNIRLAADHLQVNHT